MDTQKPGKAKMAKGSDLQRNILNGVGIVLSILLAFSIEALWDTRSERQQEEALMEGLRQEFKVNLEQLDRMVAEFRRQDALLEAYFDMPTPPTEEEARTAVRRFTLALLWADDFDPSMASLEMILNAGRPDLIFGSEIGALLWTWKTQFEDTQDDIGAFRLFIQDGRHILGRLGARGVRTDLRPPWREQFDRMRSSQELSALAQTVLRDREEYWSELETLRVTTALVLETLD